MKIKILSNRQANADLRMTIWEGTLNVNIATKPICLTQHYIPIWNRNTPKDQMEKWEIHLLAVEEEEDQEKIHTKD